MSENTSGSNKKRKVISATLAVTMAVTMLLSGTLAYYYRSLAVNEFSGISSAKDVVGHDDFDPETGNKDIYMENLGDAPVYVRIRLTEDFQISEKGGSKEQMTVYTSDEGYGGRRYDEQTLPNGTIVGNHIHGYWSEATTNTETMDFASSDAPGFHSTYFKWTMGGASSQKTYLSAKSDEYTTNAEDPKHKDVDTPAEGEDAGTLRVVYDTKNQKDTYSFTDNDHNGKDDTNEFIKKTPVQSPIIAMTAWQKLSADEKYSHTGWVLDNHTSNGTKPNSGGWYYWSQPVMGGEATGLLLDQVETLPVLKGGDYSYQYHIHVEFEAVDETDKGLWLDEHSDSHSGDKWDGSAARSTANAKELVNFISNKAQYGTQQKDLIDALNAMDAAYQTKFNAGEKYSAGAWSFVKQALDAISVGEIEKAKELKAAAEAHEVAYQEADAAGQNPDALLFDKHDASLYTKIDDEIFDYLIKNYDLNMDGSLSKDEATAVTSICFNPSAIADQYTQIETLNGITDTNFPNLNTLIIRGAQITTVNTSVLPKKLEDLKLNYTPIASFDIAPFKKDLQSLSLCGTNITEITNLETKTIRIENLDIRATHITSFTVPAETKTFLAGGQAFDDKNVYLGSRESNADATPEIYGTLDLSKAKNLTRLYIPAHNLQRIDVSAIKNMSFFPELGLSATFKIGIKRENQAFTASYPAEKILTRQDDGTLVNSEGQLCDDDGKVKTTP